MAAGLKITELDALTSVALTDVVAIVDIDAGPATTKKITVADFLAFNPFISGTPVDNQLGVWVSDTAIEGVLGLTFNGFTFNVLGDPDIAAVLAIGDVGFNAATFSRQVDDPDFQTAFSGTIDWDVIGLLGNFRLRDGAGLQINDSTDADSFTIRLDGTDVNMVGDNVADLNITGITTIQADTVDAVFKDIICANLVVGTASLTVEADSIINQDLTTDATPTFAGIISASILSASDALVLGTSAGQAIGINDLDVSIAGNLIVSGLTTTVNSETVNIVDNHLFLNADYTTVVAQSGGLTVNYLPTSTTTTVSSGAFVAGVASSSNPTVVTVGAATFSAGDLVQVSGSNLDENDGLYEVLTHVANLLTIRGIGTSSVIEDFTNNQFVANASDSAVITKVTVSVIRAGTDGIWETAAGSVTGFSFSDLITAESGVVKTGTPLDNQLAVFTDENTVEGVSGLIYNGSSFVVNDPMTINSGASSGLTINSTAIGLVIDNSVAGATFRLRNPSNNFWDFQNTIANLFTLDYNDSIKVIVDTSGKFGVGITPNSQLHIFESNAVTGIAIGLTIEQSGAGDAVIQYLLTGTQRWVVGIDNSASDSFVWSANLDLSTTPLMTLTTSGALSVAGAITGQSLSANIESNAASTLTIGEVSTTRGDAADGILQLYGEHASIIYGGQILVISQNMQFVGDLSSGNRVLTAQFALNVQVISGRTLQINNSTNTDSALFSHDGTDFNTVFTNTANWNITGITSIQAGTVDADFDAITCTSVVVDAGTTALPSYAFSPAIATGLFLGAISALDVSNVVSITAEGALGISFSRWTSADTDIAGLIAGASNAGTLLVGSSGAHVTIGLRDDDVDDGFQIVSGGGNWTGDATWDLLCFEVKADGDVFVGADLEIDGALDHDGSTAGFYATTPVSQQTGVAVTAAGVHAALVNLGLITA